MKHEVDKHEVDKHEEDKVVKILNIAKLAGEVAKFFPPLAIAGSLVSGVAELVKAGRDVIKNIKSKQDDLALAPMGA